MSSALYAVRDCFRDGGDGAEIPVTFRTTLDARSRGLNNDNIKFWRGRPGPEREAPRRRPYSRIMS